MIDLETARRFAEKAAESNLEGYVRTKPSRWLRDGNLEAKNCWLFLKWVGIEFIPGCEKYADIAFVISKKGMGLTVTDYSEDMPALEAYLLKISEYLERRGE